MNIKKLWPVISTNLILVVLLFGCGGSPADYYVVNVTTSDEDTNTQLIKLTDGDEETMTAEVVMEWERGYGAMNYILNQGSVPDQITDVPDSCHSTTSLTANDAKQCLFEPVFGDISKTLASIGLDKSDVGNTLTYLTNDNSDFTTDNIDSFDDELDNYVSDTLGYAMITEDNSVGTSYDIQGYLHDHTIAKDDRDWMGKLSADKKFSNLSIPGTHDSTASQLGGDAVITQSLDLTTQLNAGIRAFDIRLKCTGSAYLVGFHGNWYQNISFDDILGIMTTFLTSHTGEALFVRIKNEADTYNCDNGTTFQSIFNTYYQRYSKIWRPTGVEDPTLGSVRGQIVVLQDFDKSDGSTYWPIFGLAYPSWSCQDSYHLNTNWDLYDKWAGYNNFAGVKVYLVKAMAQPSAAKPTLVCNFLSGSYGSFPYFVASGHSSPGTNAPRLWTGLAGSKSGMASKYPDFEHRTYGTKKLPQASIWFTGTNDLSVQWLRNNHPKYTGIIFADFPGKDLIGEIIDANFR